MAELESHPRHSWPFSGIPAQQLPLTACPFSLLPSSEAPTQSGGWGDTVTLSLKDGFSPHIWHLLQNFPAWLTGKNKFYVSAVLLLYCIFFHLRDFLVFCSWERSLFIVVENLTFLSTPHQQRESAPGCLNAWHCILMMQLTSSCKQTHPSWCWNSQDISLLWLQLQSYSSGCCAVYTNRAESLKKLHVTRQQCKKPIKNVPMK